MLSLLMESALRSLALGAVVWLVVKLLRVRHPHAGQILWRLVLLTALTMPLLMQWQVLMLPAATPQLLSIARLDATPLAAVSLISWREIVLELYVTVVIVLFLRQAFGLVRMQRIRRAATPIHGAWTCGDIRVSDALRAPVSFGATILLPADYASWSDAKRAAVLAHERAHVANRDFAFQLLAQMHKTLFWFSPLAWWLPRQLSLSSEQMSDDAAIRATGDRTGYAQILIQFARGSERSQAVVAMARPATVAKRIERVVAEEELPPPLGAPRRMGLAIALVSLAFGVASCSADKREQVKPATDATASSTPQPPTAQPSTALAYAPLPEPVAPANGSMPKSNKAIPLTQPQYPPKSRRAGQTGTVVLQLHVLEDGSVDDVRIKESSRYARLDYAAANEALNWQLDPGVVDGKPQAMWGQFAVTFKLND